MQEAEGGKIILHLPPLMFQEVAWILAFCHNETKPEVLAFLEAWLPFASANPHEELQVIKLALALAKKVNPASITDCFIAAQAYLHPQPIRKFLSFDKDLNKLDMFLATT